MVTIHMENYKHMTLNQAHICILHRLKANLAHAMSLKYDYARTGAEDTFGKRIETMDGMVVQVFQVSLIDHLKKVHGEALWARVKEKCELESAAPSGNVMECRQVLWIVGGQVVFICLHQSMIIQTTSILTACCIYLPLQPDALCL